MDFEKLRENLRKNIFGKSLLYLFSKAYYCLYALRSKAYKKSLLKRKRVNSRVICIGNVTTGGTGKTTAVMFTAKLLAENNFKTAIVSRGYKGDLKKKEVFTVNKNTEDYKICGDEPYMMYQVLREFKVPVVVSSDKYKAAQTAIRKFKSEVILLDDGFGHFKLKRDLDIVLIDAHSGFLNEKLLPLGNLREPKPALKRAGLILLTHCDLTDEETINKITANIKKYNPDSEIIKTIHHPSHYIDAFTLKPVKLEEIKGKTAVLSAIGNPQSFEDTLKNLNLSLEQIWRYPDHHVYTSEEMETIGNLKKDIPLITTYKDFIRFPENWRDKIKNSVYILSINLKLVDEEKDLPVLKKILNI